MIQELVYTSVPQGLKPGSRGFCTVATTPNLPRNLLERLESLSGYHHLFPVGDPRSGQNPVAFSHVRLSIGGKRCHVLSRVSDAGLDYTQRSNKLAHHLVLESKELPDAGPAAILATSGLMQTVWQGEPGLLDSRSGMPPITDRQGPCVSWQRACGDAGWAGVLASSIAGTADRAAIVIYPLGTNVLELIAEALQLLPPNARWGVTFNTYFTKLAPGIECRWRCVAADTPEAKAARADRQALVIDLTRPLGKPPQSALADFARTGVRSAAVDAHFRELQRTAQKPGEASGSGMDFIPIARAVQSTSRPPSKLAFDPLYDDDSSMAARRKPDSPMKLIGIGAGSVLGVLILLGVVVKIVFPAKSAAPSRIITVSKPDTSQIDEIETAQRHNKELHRKFLETENRWNSLENEVAQLTGEIMPPHTHKEDKSGNSSKSQIEEWKKKRGTLGDRLTNATQEFDKLRIDIERVTEPPPIVAREDEKELTLDFTKSKEWIAKLTDLANSLEIKQRDLEKPLVTNTAKVEKPAQTKAKRLTDGRLLDIKHNADLELPTRLGKPAGPINLGRVYSLPSEVRLALLGAKSAGNSLEIQEVKPPTEGDRCWKISRTTKLVTEPFTFATLFIQQDVDNERVHDVENNRLHFKWMESVTFEALGNNPLSRCVLNVSIGDKEHQRVQFINPTEQLGHLNLPGYDGPDRRGILRYHSFVLRGEELLIPSVDAMKASKIYLRVTPDGLPASPKGNMPWISKNEKENSATTKTTKSLADTQPWNDFSSFLEKKGPDGSNNKVSSFYTVWLPASGSSLPLKVETTVISSPAIKVSVTIASKDPEAVKEIEGEYSLHKKDIEKYYAHYKDEVDALDKEIVKLRSDLKKLKEMMQIAESGPKPGREADNDVKSKSSKDDQSSPSLIPVGGNSLTTAEDMDDGTGLQEKLNECQSQLTTAEKERRDLEDLAEVKGGKAAGNFFNELDRVKQNLKFNVELYTEVVEGSETSHKVAEIMFARLTIQSSPQPSVKDPTKEKAATRKAPAKNDN